MRMSSMFRTRFGSRTPDASNTLGHSIFGIGYGCRDGLPGCCPCAELALSRRLLCDACVCKPTRVCHSAAAGAGLFAPSAALPTLVGCAAARSIRGDRRRFADAVSIR